MGSFSSSSLSSSNRGLKAYLTERQTGFTSQFKKTKKSKKTKQPTPTSPPPYLWLLADGRHRNMMTNRMMENKKRQNASSIHSSLQSCRRRHRHRETFLMKAFTNPHLQEEKRLKMKHVLVFFAGLNERIYKNESNLKM